MGVLTSMSTAIKGLEANGNMLSLISDNIVNANTTGYKGSRAEFHSMLSEDGASSSGGQVGSGVRVAGITNLHTQGSISRTDRSTDLAISGQGFFVLKGNQGMTYTRDGSFRFDREGWLTTLTGERVQAYSAASDSKISGKMGDVRIPYGAIPAKTTSRIELHVNLDSRMEVSAPLDLQRPEETAQFTSATQVYDSIGNSHAVSLYFNKTAQGMWEWTAMADGAEMEGGQQGTQVAVAKGNLAFDSVGRLVTSEQEVLNSSFSGGAIPNQEIKFDFGDPIDKSGTGQKGTTQYGSKNALYRSFQDGYTTGVLSDASIDSDGSITGVYSNGQNRLIGQIAMARFESAERLYKIGSNQYKDTIDSGQPQIGKCNTGGRGSLLTKHLEGSNIDIAKEFVEMIRAQRGFQASAKSISTANEMMQEVINMIS